MMRLIHTFIVHGGGIVRVENLVFGKTEFMKYDQRDDPALSWRLDDVSKLVFAARLLEVSNGRGETDCGKRAQAGSIYRGREGSN
jgi:hypothetical protein